MHGDRLCGFVDSIPQSALIGAGWKLIFSTNLWYAVACNNFFSPYNMIGNKIPLMLSEHVM